MAEAAGLVIGVAALFSTCVEVFDIVVSAKECSREFEELSALLGLQRLRFELWGESVGLPSGRFDHEQVIPYNSQLDLPHIRTDIERALDNIRDLLSRVTAINGRYGVTLISATEYGTTTLKGIRIFRKSFEPLKARTRKSQKEHSILGVTRWALRDATLFKKTIASLTALVDALFEVTTALGLVEQRYEALRVHEAISAITVKEDLELLAESASRHSGSSIYWTVSDAASRRSAHSSSSDNPKTLPLRYELCDVEDLILLIADMISELMPMNDQISCSIHTKFHSRTTPEVSVVDYLQRLTIRASLTPPLLLSMVYYIDRLCNVYPPFIFGTLTMHRFLITAATVAAKGLSDSHHNNATYAHAGDIDVAELGMLELEFLCRMDWRIVPNHESLEAYYCTLVQRVDWCVLEEDACILSTV